LQWNAWGWAGFVPGFLAMGKTWARLKISVSQQIEKL
jgi:hypothetical protein